MLKGKNPAFSFLSTFSKAFLFEVVKTIDYLVKGKNLYKVLVDLFWFNTLKCLYECLYECILS